MFVVCSGGGVRHFQRPPFHRRRLRRRALAAARSCRRWCSSWQPWRPQVRALGERASRTGEIILPHTEHGLLPIDIPNGIMPSDINDVYGRCPFTPVPPVQPYTP